MGKLETILQLISEYTEEKNNEKKWKEGVDWDQYAGPFFSSEEYTQATKSLLSGWLALGKDSIRFENKFPKYFDKKYGILTNSGSSSNLIMMSSMTSKRL